MNKRNYMREMEEILKSLDSDRYKPPLLLHVCCAPCASGCLDLLIPYFDITAFFYNPNMDTLEEYKRRANEFERFVREADLPIKTIIRQHESHKFYEFCRGLEDEPEGGRRCFKCYELRLRETAKFGSENDFAYYSTTLTLSPYKNAEVINQLGERLGVMHGIKWLPSDFKKKDGFKKSTEVSREYGLYRQNYCGCVYSKGGDIA